MPPSADRCRDEMNAAAKITPSPVDIDATALPACVAYPGFSAGGSSLSGFTGSTFPSPGRGGVVTGAATADRSDTPSRLPEAARRMSWRSRRSHSSARPRWCGCRDVAWLLRTAADHEPPARRVTAYTTRQSPFPGYAG
jgi:hypothetical protein